MGVIQNSINQALGTAAALKAIKPQTKHTEVSSPMAPSQKNEPQLTPSQNSQIKQWDIMIDAMKAESLRIQAQNRAKFLMKKMRRTKEEINKRRESNGKNTGLGNA